MKDHRDAIIIADALENLHMGGVYEFYMDRIRYSSMYGDAGELCQWDTIFI